MKPILRPKKKRVEKAGEIGGYALKLKSIRVRVGPQMHTLYKDDVVIVVEPMTPQGDVNIQFPNNWGITRKHKKFLDQFRRVY